MKTIYSEEVLELMRDFFETLPERSRRLYAALESLKLGHGGIIYISQVFKIEKRFDVGEKSWRICALQILVLDSTRKAEEGGKKLLSVANFAKS